MFSITQKTNEYMNIVLTHECNKRCPFCIDKYRGSGEFIELETVISALHKAKESGVKDILLIGGEPTLHPRIVEISKMVKSFGFRLIVTTNYTKPEIVKLLDGIVDCFNISFYGQSSLPKQEEYLSDITLHTLIHQDQLSTKQELDSFIEEHQEHGHLKFSTLSPCNDWAKEKQGVGYLDDIDCEWVVLFNEMLGQLYNGAVIKRYDKVFRTTARQSLKCHVDGEISDSWNRQNVTNEPECKR